jgi:hypothetical protein
VGKKFNLSQDLDTLKESLKKKIKMVGRPKKKSYLT